MNARGGDARKMFFGPRPNKGYRDKDEDLHLFREMQKREKDRIVSLLQPVSDEFEANGNYGLYGGMVPGKKGPAYDILGETSKNDYDWLKTPPATPLFPSLEMDATHLELAVQRELPIIQPLTRFAGKSEQGKASTQRKSKSPEDVVKPKVLPRYSTPTGRPSISLSEKKNIKSAPIINHKMINQSKSNLNLEITKKPSSLIPNSHENKEILLNFLPSNLSRCMGKDSLNSSIKVATRQKIRGTSPSIRSRIPPQIQGISNETPSNLKTQNDHRSISASRGRTKPSPLVSQKQEPTGKTTRQSCSLSTTTTKPSPSVSQKQEPTGKTTRQSCSPSGTRGRKQENDHATTNHKDKIRNNRTQVVGSRMVERFLNSRMSNSEDGISNKTKTNSSMNESSDSKKITSIEERQNKTKFNTSINESSGFGRLISKSSLDMALKHMEFQKDSGLSSISGTTTTTRRSSSVSRRNPTS